MKTHKRSLSHFNITAVDAGNFVPIQIQEVLPGDTFQASTSALVRLQPMVAPTMHPIHITIAHWFVPNRIVWDNWEDFITNPSSTAVMPTIQHELDGTNQNPYQYMGAESPSAGYAVMNALPQRAYNLIWNEYIRDQDLQTVAAISLADGPDAITDKVLQKVSWQKDHLTSARPWAQKGPQVTIPVQSSGNIPISGIGKVDATFATGSVNSRESDGSIVNYPNASFIDGVAANGYYVDEGTTGFPNIHASQADLEAFLYTLPNDIRIGIAYQKWEELAARYGTRYTEYLRARFGVLAQDSRLQRPEFLSMGTQTIQMSEVLQTSNPGTPTDPEDATGALKGHGIGKVRSNAFRKFFPEHGYVITCAWIRPINIYSTGAPRLFFKSTKFDYFTHEFAHIGSASIYKGETCVQDETATPGLNKQDWGGYFDQYYDYRRRLSYVSGNVRSILNYWTESRGYPTPPTLNSTFIECLPSDRIFAAPIEQNYMLMVHNKTVVRGQVPAIGSTSNF